MMSLTKNMAVLATVAAAQKVQKNAKVNQTVKPTPTQKVQPAKPSTKIPEQVVKAAEKAVPTTPVVGDIRDAEGKWNMDTAAYAIYPRNLDMEEVQKMIDFFYSGESSGKDPMQRLMELSSQIQHHMWWAKHFATQRYYAMLAFNPEQAAKDIYANFELRLQQAQDFYQQAQEFQTKFQNAKSNYPEDALLDSALFWLLLAFLTLIIA